MLCAVMGKVSHKKPEPIIDGAKVLYWAWSGEEPFGWVGDPNDPEAVAIFGLAIARYDNDEHVYRFSCDANWETAQDGLYDTTEEAIEWLPDQYKKISASWQKYECD